MNRIIDWLSDSEDRWVLWGNRLSDLEGWFYTHWDNFIETRLFNHSIFINFDPEGESQYDEWKPWAIRWGIPKIQRFLMMSPKVEDIAWKLGLWQDTQWW